MEEDNADDDEHGGAEHASRGDGHGGCRDPWDIRASVAAESLGGTEGAAGPALGGGDGVVVDNEGTTAVARGIDRRYLSCFRIAVVVMVIVILSLLASSPV